jgi:hypothetical protein
LYFGARDILRTILTRADNFRRARGIEALIAKVDFQKWSKMKAMKVIRNILGTVSLLYAGYVLVASMKDVRRYIRIATM